MSCNDKIELKVAVVKANTGADAIKRAPIVEEDTGVRCLRIGDISNNRPIEEWGFTSASYDVVEKFELKKDDIVIARTGNTIGVVKYIDEDIKSVYNNGLIRIKIDNEFNSKFIYYNLISNDFKSFIYGISAGTSTQPNMKIEHMLQYKINKFSLEEQEKIANILSSLDDKIQLNNEVNKTLEDTAQSIFKRWFVDFEFPNEDGEPYKSSGGEMVDSELGMIPKGWEVGTLDNLGVFKNGKGIKQDLRNDNGKNLIYGSNGIIGKTDDVLQKDNCIIIGRVGAYCGSIQLSLEPCWVTDNAIMGTAKQKEYLPYLHRFLLNYPLRESAGGSAQPLINQSILKSILTVIPPNELFDKYYNISKEIISKIDDNNKENIMLCEIRDSLLPELMSGEIKV